MTVTLKINSLVSQIVLAAALLLLGLGCISGIFLNYLARTVADRRIVMRREALVAAASKLPNSARVQFRLAEAEMVESAFDSQTLARVQAHAALAINNSPWDYKPWRLLAAAQESDGKPEEAEKSLLAATKLAPSNVEVKWALANLLLRQGKLNESLDAFAAAVKGNRDLLPSAFDLLWQVSNGNLTTLETVAGKDAKSQLSLVQFLAEQSQIEAAVQIYRGIGESEKLKSPSAHAFITSMLKAEQFSTARELWLETVRSSTNEKNADLIWNGSFEVDLQKEFNHFDWVIAPSDYARIGFDTNAGHSGGRSLKIIFAGRDTTKLEGEIKQLVALKPSTRYRLECYVKASNLVTPEGPRLALLSQNRIMTVSEPIASGSTEWRQLAGEFISPAQPVATFITIARLPRFSYDEPTRGTIWFDDFKLTEL